MNDRSLSSSGSLAAPGNKKKKRPIDPEAQKEKEKERRIRHIQNRSLFEEAEDLQMRYRARRLPPLNPKVVPLSREAYVDSEEEEVEEEPAKKKRSVLMQKLAEFATPKVSYELSPEAKRAIKALALNRSQVSRLLKKYLEIDVKKQNQITKTAFWESMDVTRTAFSDKIFELIDSDSSGMMDYSEFVSVLVTFCCFNRDDILRFAFDCFDEDGSGWIDMKEVEALVDMVQAQDPIFDKNVKGALEALRSDDDGKINFEEFRTLNQYYPMLLRPAFALQDKMHKHTLGPKGWVKVMENMNHEENDRERRRRQFGMPVRFSPIRRVLSVFGLARWYPRIDVDYINTMRPSRIVLLKDVTEEDVNDKYALEASMDKLALQHSALSSSSSARLRSSSSSSSFSFSFRASSAGGGAAGGGEGGDGQKRRGGNALSRAFSSLSFRSNASSSGGGGGNGAAEAEEENVDERDMSFGANALAAEAAVVPSSSSSSSSSSSIDHNGGEGESGREGGDVSGAMSRNGGVTSSSSASTSTHRGLVELDHSASSSSRSSSRSSGSTRRKKKDSRRRKGGVGTEATALATR